MWTPSLTQGVPPVTAAASVMYIRQVASGMLEKMMLLQLLCTHKHHGQMLAGPLVAYRVSAPEQNIALF